MFKTILSVLDWIFTFIIGRILITAMVLTLYMALLVWCIILSPLVAYNLSKKYIQNKINN
jgi:hypothetical protein